jgi:competence protein ComEC
VKALLARRDEGLARRLGRSLAGLLLTGFAVELAIAPIALFHFHQAGLFGALANIVAIPLTTFVIMPLEALALLLDPIGLGAPFWWAAGQGLSLLLGLAHAVASAPGAVALMPAIPPAAFALFVAGLLWIGLWRTRWRWWGAAPAAFGAVWALMTPPPDLLVTSDGRHMALRTPSGELAILRPRAGDYVRDLLAEISGSEPDFIEMAEAEGGACSDALCRYDLQRGPRTWRILATTSRNLVRWDQMIAACAAADIVISDRTLPRACQPRWLKADRPFLAEHGGLAFTFGDGAVLATVRDQIGLHPWAGTVR